MKGCICLDIDGTITADTHFVPDKVLECLHFLHKRGWKFLFATGRTYSFALKTLEKVDFPFFFSVQNGADLLHRPDEKLIDRHYLASDIIPVLEEITKDTEEDFLVYSGWELGDFCYYRPKNFTKLFLDHIAVIQEFSKEPWRRLENFSFDKEEKFPLIKYISSKESATTLYDKIKHIPGIEVSCIKDPISEGVYLNLITAKHASKGEALRKTRPFFDKGTLFIAAGDDFNDVSMLEEADIGIAMGTAPAALSCLADIKAGSAKEMGIIKALLEATKEEEV